ncbi:Catabolic L-serine/threonine dehydratase [Seminavis robusta]|uniref:L-serine ammonia-lyase n=1 Tax=Seminavis robusta TaxID=568900 RepID=A0A9N8H8U0_9STRA|nr:Catabolic L-serine/threonine dehydratase [Seminavis robusta]|eukprot:Sro169_g075190.1 Catabolic L-serine/threonine dehydratase (334) ;mRNA; f:74026-75119
MSAANVKSALETGLYIRTPLIKSAPLSKLTGKDVYIKLDCLQPSGSFKDRGMANLCQTLQSTKGTQKLIASSGGNAGLAVATVAPKKGMTVSVVVPESTKPNVIERLKALGAEVTVHGKIWNEADLLARQRVDEDPQAEYVSPYDNQLLWTGHSTLVDEVMEDLPQVGAVIVGVGGGGLMCGVLEGLERHGQTSSKVIACETEGAASFCKSWLKSPPALIRLDTISSIATSLGALEVTQVAIDRSLKHQENGGTVQAAICTDKEAVEACLQFSSDHRIMVEPACGAGLAALYSERLRKQTLEGVEGPIVVEICGGSGVNLSLLNMWKKDLGIE